MVDLVVFFFFSCYLTLLPFLLNLVSFLKVFDMHINV